MAETELSFRAAAPEDASAVAHLHGDSWRRHYRGAYADLFLDGDVFTHLTERWTERLAAPPPEAITIVAEYDGKLVGLAHTELDEDPTWGALVDNLHVSYALKRQGIGTRLLALTARAVIDAEPSSALHLWVLEQNSAAQAFYLAQGGTIVGREDTPAPGGNPDWLNGKPMCLQIGWRDPSVLIKP